MKAVGHLVSAKEIEQIAEWLSTQPRVMTAVLDHAQAASEPDFGHSLYRQDEYSTCRGKPGKIPIMLGFPYLEGPKKDYLVIQISDVKECARTVRFWAAKKPVSAFSGEEMELI